MMAESAPERFIESRGVAVGHTPRNAGGQERRLFVSRAGEALTTQPSANLTVMIRQ